VVWRDEVHLLLVPWYSPLIANSPFFSWIYHITSISTFGRFLGSFELLAAALLALKPWFPKAAVLGGLLASLFFVVTLSFMITTPGVGEASAGGLPVLSANGQFLVKRHRASGPIAVAGGRGD
jgi:reactive chlorine resistance protein C